MKKRIISMFLGLAALTTIATGVWVLLFAPRPTRLSVTARVGDDTIVVNQMQSRRLGVSVLDQYSRRMAADTAVRYQRISGDAIPLSPDGDVRCATRGEAVVRATFEHLSKQFVLRCRPVKWIEAPTWLDLVVGDSARDLPFTSYGPDRRMVTELRGAVTVPDGSIVDLDGTTVRPRRTGATVAVIAIGDRDVRVPILVYQPVASFVGNPGRPRLMAMRVSLTRGDTIIVPVPRGAFWVTYFSTPRSVAPPTIELVGEGSCTTGDGLHARRIETGEYAKYCHTGHGTRMMIAHGADGAARVNGVVAIRLMW